MVLIERWEEGEEVARFLEAAASRLDLGGKKIDEEKVYHELRDSYTWTELIEQVKTGTEVGRRYVESILEAAKEENKSLTEYLGEV